MGKVPLIKAIRKWASENEEIASDIKCVKGTKVLAERLYAEFIDQPQIDAAAWRDANMQFQITIDDVERVHGELTEDELEYLETRLDQITESLLESWYATRFDDMLREEIKWRIEVRMADDPEVNQNDDP